MNELLKGAYDLHIHSAPDVLPRKMDDIEMAQRIIESGMAGYAIKSHYFCTAERAQLINKMYPECQAIGAITLNASVGGINPMAVEMAARAGTKIVWFPTCDSSYEQECVFKNTTGKLAYWAQIIIDLKAEGVNYPTFTIIDDSGELTQATKDVLKVIAKYNMILSTGHMSHAEIKKLVEGAKEAGVKNIIITHATFPTTFFTVEEQKYFISLGAIIEHCFTTYKTGKVEFATILEQIKAVGSENVILGTDLGQKTALYPDEGLLEFAEELMKNGLTKDDIKTMIVKNPRKLLGMEE